MNMVCPDEGKLRFLAVCFGYGGAGPGTGYIHLFKNDYTPDDDTTSTSFTDATFTGSDPIPYGGSDFGAPAIVSHVAEITMNTAPEWTCTGGGPETIYGWYMLDSGSGKVLLAQRFDSPHVMDVGATETLDPFTVKLKTFS